MNYYEKVEIIAGMWEFRFAAGDMTMEEQMEFRDDCVKAKVNILDVLGRMGE